MVVEPAAGDRLEDNLNPVSRMYYAASTMVCIPTSLDQPVGAAFGAKQASPSSHLRLRKAASAKCAKRLRRRSTWCSKRGLKALNRSKPKLPATPRAGARAKPEVLLHRGRSSDLATVDEGFVVALDFSEVVEIVDHDAEGLLEPPRRQVSHPVDALEPRAVAEMKAGDRVQDRPSGRPALRK